jgi:hypothetical protein
MLTLIPFVMIRGAHLPTLVAGPASADYGRLAARRHALTPVRPALAIVRRRRRRRLAMRHDAPRWFERDLLGGPLPPILLLTLGMSLAIAPLTTLLVSVIGGPARPGGNNEERTYRQKETAHEDPNHHRRHLRDPRHLDGRPHLRP